MADNQRTIFEAMGVEIKPNEYDLPENLWPLIDKIKRKSKWTAEDIDYWVPKLRSFCEVEEKWQNIFLSPLETIDLAGKNKDFTASTVKKLAKTAQVTEDAIPTPAERTKFHKWLSDNSKGNSWDFRKIIRYRREFEANQEDAKSQWIFGDWREHIHTIKDNTGRLLLIDPPYGMDYHSDRRSDRRTPRKHSKIENDTLDAALLEVEGSLKAVYDKLATNAHVLCFCHWKTEALMMEVIRGIGYTIRGSLIWYKNNAGMGDPFTTFAPQHERIIHAVKGSPILFKRKPDVATAAKVRTDNHPTEKPINLLKPFIECTTAKGELVIDMFGGVASTHVAAKLSGRKYWGAEKVKKFFDIGKQRIKTCDSQTSIYEIRDSDILQF